MNIKFKNKEFTIKKIYLIISGVILILIILLTIFSCNANKKLNCKSNINGSTSIIEKKYNATFKNNKLSKMVVSYKNTPTGNFQYMLNDIYENYDGQLKKLKNAGGYNYTINKGSDYVFYESEINLNKIPDSTKSAVGYNNMWTYKEFKTDLEKNGFTCK
ncbi:MAG: hypothetical protein RR325_03975 [Bacilli bacterium]